MVPNLEINVYLQVQKVDSALPKCMEQNELGTPYVQNGEMAVLWRAGREPKAIGVADRLGWYAHNATQKYLTAAENVKEAGPGLLRTPLSQAQ